MRSLPTFIQIHRRVKQRGTWYSLLVVLMLFGFFLEAYMHNFNLVYITLFFVFAIAFSAGPIGIYNLGRLYVSFECTGRLFAHEEGKLFFNVRNTASSPSWAVSLHCDELTSMIGRIDADGVQGATLLINPKRRGHLDCGECRLQSLFPLSTVRFVLPLGKLCDTIVYPRPYGQSLLSYIRQQKAHFGEEIDFDGVVTYSGAESLSRIHWASVAKGEMSVKVYTHEHDTQELNFDFYSSGTDDEMRLSQLCKWVLECEKSQHSYSINMPHRLLRSKKESTDVILEYLATY